MPVLVQNVLSSVVVCASENQVRDLLKCQNAPVLGSVGGQLNSPRPVVEDRLLVEWVALEQLSGVSEVAAVRGIDIHGTDECDRAQKRHAPEKNHREDHGEAVRRRSRGKHPCRYGDDVVVEPGWSA